MLMVAGHRGWSPVTAVVLWRRMLGILGDVNEIKNPDIHQRVFKHLNELWDVLFKVGLHQKHACFAE